MTAALLAPRKPDVAFFHSGYMGLRPTKRFGMQDGRQILQLEDVPVFRTGTFADSYGDLNTWEPIHMAQMVSNYNFLVQTQTFPKVPVRKGHGALFSDPMQSLIGWHTNLRSEDLKSPVDGNTYTYLLASYYLFDPEAILRVDAEDWPNRSSEVGMYVNNNQTQYWPCYMGFAYVDIPAVEGLNFSKQVAHDAGDRFSILIENPKEFGVTTPAGGATAPNNASGTPELSLPNGGQQAQQPQPTPFVFSVNGKTTQDFAAVQAHISSLEARNVTLEQFATESREQGRKDFVSGLAAGDKPKILQAQVESLTALALTMNESQFSAFKASYENLPGLSVLQNHGNSNGSSGAPGGSGGAGAANEKEDRIAICEGVVAQHKMAGKPHEFIKNTASYKELMTIKPDFVL